MNKIFLATSGPIKPEDELIDKLEELSKKYDGDIVGILDYKEEMLFERPQVFVEGLKEMDATYIFFIEQNFVFSEVINDCVISKETERLGIKLIDVSSGKEVQEIIDAMPKSFIDKVKAFKETEFLNMTMISEHLQNDHKNQDHENLQHFQKIQNDQHDENKRNVVIISDHSVSGDEVKSYAQQYLVDHFIEDRLTKVCGLHFGEFDKKIEKKLNDLIEELGNLKIIIYNDIDSPNFKSYMDSIQSPNIDLEYREEYENTLNYNLMLH